MATEPVFSEIIHAPIRLRICGLLRAADQVDFSLLREALDVSDVNLSKHLKALVESGLVVTMKGSSATRADRRRVTWCQLTMDGQRAFDRHVAALRQIAAGADLGALPANLRSKTGS